MCLFPRLNTNENSVSYRAGIKTFACGTCPECLSRKSSYWALKAMAEARNKRACMITLTYNNEVRDRRGNIIGERDPSKMQVDKRDCQLFIKRLRKYLQPQGIKIKYLIAAEYGSTTGRPHYHAIIFGYDFPDRVRYKKSKRGNSVFISPTLRKIWGHGIVSVDSVHINASVARYCTKYAVKDAGNPNTFMLFSQGIGNDNLFDRFTGKPYLYEGRYYPIPKAVWYKYIEDKYVQYDSSTGELLYSFKYRGSNYPEDVQRLYRWYNLRARKLLINDPLYQAYRVELYFNAVAKPKKSIYERILTLDDKKYFSYKKYALRVYRLQASGVPLSCPRSSQSYWWKIESYKYNRELELCAIWNKPGDPNTVPFYLEPDIWYEDRKQELKKLFSCDYPPCLIIATDTQLMKHMDNIDKMDKDMSYPCFDFGYLYGAEAQIVDYELSIDTKSRGFS